MNSEVEKKLKAIKIEDYIWIIYIGIIILSFYSNSLERKYYIFKDLKCKKDYQNIISIIFAILVVVYLYFLKSSFDDLISIKPTDSEKKKNLVLLSFFASLLIAISGFIYLYISLVDNELDVELAFN